MQLMNQCLQTITLINNDVECCVNSAFWTVCWTHLLRAKQTLSDWQIATPFLQLPCEGSHQTIDLKTHVSADW